MGDQEQVYLLMSSIRLSTISIKDASRDCDPVEFFYICSRGVVESEEEYSCKLEQRDHYCSSQSVARCKMGRF